MRVEPCVVCDRNTTQRSADGITPTCSTACRQQHECKTCDGQGWVGLGSGCPDCTTRGEP